MKVGCVPGEHIRFGDSSQFISLIQAYIEQPSQTTVYEITDLNISDKQG